MLSFENLRVYQEGIKFADYIYTLTNNFPKDEIFGLTNQIRRASVSIVLNIAEGSSRTKKDFRHFLDLSRGSCYECAAVLTLAKNQKYISETEFNKGYEWCEQLAKTISALKNSINNY